MKMIKKQQREKRKEYKKELKRFDAILKEIFSEAIGIIYYLATGRKIGKKIKAISAEIRLVKTFRPDILVEADGEIIRLKYKLNKIKLYHAECFAITMQ